MFINLNKDGTIAKVIGSRVFRKSNSVSTIALFAPFAKDASIKINYTLPDGSAFTDVMLYQEFSQDEEKNLFTCKVTHSITEIEGRVNVSLEIHATNNDQVEIQTTAETYITVEASTSNDLALPQEDVFMNAVNGVNAQAQTNKEDISLLNEHLTGSDTTITEYMANTDQAVSDLQQKDVSLDSDIASVNSDIASANSRIDTKVKSVSVDNTVAVPKIHYETDTQQFNIDIKGFVIDASYNASTGVVTLNTSGDDIPDITYDLPTELRFESGRYDEATKDLIMVLANGSEIAIPVDDIFKPISDLETRATNIETKNTVQDNRLDTIEGAYLKKDGSVEMDEGYQPTTPKGLANKDYVDKSIEAVTGTDLSNITTPAQLDAAINEVKAELDDPTFVEEVFDKAVNTPLTAIYHAPQEMVSIQGKTLPILTPEEQAIAEYYVDDTLKNSVIDTETCPRLNEKLRQKLTVDVDVISVNTGLSANLDFVVIKKPTDDINYGNTLRNNVDLEDYPYYDMVDYDFDDVSIIGKIITRYSSTQYAIGITKGSHDVTSARALLNGKKLTYQLTIENPNEKLIVDSDVTLYTGLAEIDLIQIPKPTDSLTLADTSLTGIATLEGYEECASISTDNVGKFNIKGVVNKVSVIVAKDSHDLTSAKALLNGLKLTYQLAQPRILQTTLESVVNPLTKIVGKNLIPNELTDQWTVIKVKPLESYTISFSNVLNATSWRLAFQLYKNGVDVSNLFVSFNTLETYYNEGNGYLIWGGDRTSLSDGFTNCDFDEIWIKLSAGDINSESITENAILNKGDTPLPYEPYQSNQKQYTCELPKYTSIKGDVKFNGSGLINLGEYGDITLFATNDTTYTFMFTSLMTNNNIIIVDNNYQNGIINMFDFMSQADEVINNNINVRHWRPGNGSTSLMMIIEKSIIDEIMVAQGLDEVNALKYYLDDVTGIKGQFVGEKATITEEPLVPTVSWLDDDPVFDKDCTIYQESDTDVLPITTFKCPLDTSAQVIAVSDNQQEILKDLKDEKSRVDTNETNITNIMDGTTPAGNANKLNGNLPSFYAEKSLADDIVSGQQAVGDANKLDGQSPTYYAKASDLQGVDSTVQSNANSITNIENGTTAVGNASKLGGQVPTYYGKASDVSTNATNIQANKDDILDKVDKYVDLWTSPESYGYSLNELTETTFALAEDISNFRFIEITWTWSSGFDQVFKHVSKVRVPVEVSANMYSISCFGGIAAVDCLPTLIKTNKLYVNLKLESASILAMRNPMREHTEQTIPEGVLTHEIVTETNFNIHKIVGIY